MLRAPYVRVYIGDNEKRDISYAVESFSFKDGIKKDSKVDITIKSDFTLKLIDEDDLVTGATLSFYFGYMGDVVSQTHRARITDLEVTYADRVNMVIRALDSGTVMKRTSSPVIWKGKTATEIATTIALNYGLEPVVDETTRVYDNISQGNRSDFDFLKFLAGSEADGNYVFFIRNNSLNFVRIGYDKRSTRTYTYNQSNELISFVPKWRESTADSSSLSVKINTIDLKSKLPIKADANAKNEKKSVELGDFKVVYDENGIRKGFEDGAETIVKIGKEAVSNISVNNPVAQPTAPPYKDEYVNLNIDKNLFQFDKHHSVWNTRFDKDVKKVPGKGIVIPVKSQIDANNKVNALKKGGTAKILTATLEIKGDPLSAPNTVITMANVARRHVGNWLVEEVSHSIVPGSAYTTSMEMHKNGTQSRTGIKSNSPNKTTGNKKKTDGAEDKVILSVYDADGNHIKDETQSGKYVAPKDLRQTDGTPYQSIDR